MGILLVIMIIITENVIRTGMLTGQLWSRFTLVMAICFSALSLTNLTNDLLRLDVGDFTWRGLFGPVVYAVIAAVFFWMMDQAKLRENTT